MHHGRRHDPAIHRGRVVLRWSRSTNLPDDLPLIERSVLDSLGLFQLVGYLESEFGVEILDEELIPQNFGTITDIARLVREKERYAGDRN